MALGSLQPQICHCGVTHLCIVRLGAELEEPRLLSAHVLAQFYSYCTELSSSICLGALLILVFVYFTAKFIYYLFCCYSLLVKVSFSF